MQLPVKSLSTATHFPLKTDQQMCIYGPEHVERDSREAIASSASWRI
jgi:hypothetical protein